MSTFVVSQLDKDFLDIIRRNVRDFLKMASMRYTDGHGRLLDIAPQVHEGARPYFPEAIMVETLDIDPASGCTHIGDICSHNDHIPDDSFDFVVCTEVLEHTLHPFHAVDEIRRVLKPGGKLFLSVPFNFRIHGPLPDCWRFTEHGLRTLLRDYEVIELNSLETDSRPLMPVHYTVVARKPLSGGKTL